MQFLLFTSIVSAIALAASVNGEGVNCNRSSNSSPLAMDALVEAVDFNVNPNQVYSNGQHILSSILRLQISAPP
jgi:hypothetical protein